MGEVIRRRSEESVAASKSLRLCTEFSEYFIARSFVLAWARRIGMHSRDFVEAKDNYEGPSVGLRVT